MEKNIMPARSKIRTMLGTFLKTLGVAFLIAAAAGFIYEETGRRTDRKRLPQIGQSFDIGGRSLNIFCSGAGSPPVIFDAAASQPGLSWAHIQPEVAKFTRACWYDRAGEGWSDPGPFPRTSGAIAKDLHILLQHAGISPPYVLVGASFGGLNVRVFNGLYPSEVAGMVLVDSAHEDEPKRAPPAYLGRTLPPKFWYPLYLLVQTATRFGVVRLLSHSTPLPDDPSQRTPEQIVEALRQQPKSIATIASDATTPESYAQAHASGGLGDRPLIVLTRGKPALGVPESELDRQAAEYEQVWMHEIQPQLARLSTRGRQIIVQKSGHRISNEAPEAVLDAVREVFSTIQKERFNSPLPKNP